MIHNKIPIQNTSFYSKRAQNSIQTNKAFLDNVAITGTQTSIKNRLSIKNIDTKIHGMYK